LSETGGGEILELGAGTGRMAAAVLESLAATGVLPDRYSILEVSADLAERQRERLSSLPASLRERVVWLDRLPERPLRGVILANEVLDALPCQRFVVAVEGTAASAGPAGGAAGGSEHFERELGIHELGVSSDGDTFVERASQPDTALATACESLLKDLPHPLPPGYTSEVCLRLEPWIAGVGDCLERGLLLLFDYGLPRSH
jgi:SAM-dependent MidA family methyltransferase